MIRCFFRFVLRFSAGSLLLSCFFCDFTEVVGKGSGSKQSVGMTSKENQRFKTYWGKGKAELNRYSLQQARYGRIHAGEAILIFVTEDFLTDQKVKNETYKSKNSTKVLKLNFNRKFITGIYDYSTMVSVFTPVSSSQHPHTLKVSASSQEWCGHTYSHLNFDHNEYELVSHSYFEKEVFENYDLDPSLLEDEIMVRIRISPDHLPLGKIKIIPSLLYSRLKHFRLSIESGVAQKIPNRDRSFSGQNLMVYQIQYTSIDRTFKVIYQNKFPYSIAGFTEETGSRKKGGKRQVTKAIRTHSIMSDYWVRNHPEDKPLRKKLGLY